jgi:hypothetical protein
MKLDISNIYVNTYITYITYYARVIKTIMQEHKL